MQNLDTMGCVYTLFGTVFSTVELNQTIVFKAHDDGNNVLGTLVGITALGSFIGGAACISSVRIFGRTSSP